MAFRFKRKESVAKAIRRIGAERVQDALGCLQSCERAEATHCARKDLKKLRAVLRLVETEVGGKELGRLTKELRDAAGHLAEARDAIVKAKTLRNLARHFKGQLIPGAFRHTRQRLREAAREALEAFARERTAGKVREILLRVQREWARVGVKAKGWKAIAPGLERAYRKSRRAYRQARKESSPEHFHAWRKHAKDLGYDVRLLGAVWPEQMDALATELETLGEQLGDDHDLVVLGQAVLGGNDGGSNLREAETLAGLIDQRQRELRDAALALGARFFAEKPSAFSERIGRYWHTWRSEKKAGLQRTAAA